MSRMVDHYGLGFYARRMQPGRQLKHFEMACMMLRVFQKTFGCIPSSVLDVGCGSGWHLNVTRPMLPLAKLTGIDRGEAPKSLWLLKDDKNAEFIDMDLTQPASLASGRSDLVWCLDVAEHLKPECSERFAEFVAGATGKMLIFAGAPTGSEGGNSRNHCNCRPDGYWAGLLSKLGLTKAKRLTAWIRLMVVSHHSIRHLDKYIEVFVRL